MKSCRWSAGGLAHWRTGAPAPVTPLAGMRRKKIVVCACTDSCRYLWWCVQCKPSGGKQLVVACCWYYVQVPLVVACCWYYAQVWGSHLLLILRTGMAPLLPTFLLSGGILSIHLVNLTPSRIHLMNLFIKINKFAYDIKVETVKFLIKDLR